MKNMKQIEIRALIRNIMRLDNTVQEFFGQNETSHSGGDYLPDDVRLDLNSAA